MFNFWKWVYLRPGIYKKEKNEDIENKIKILDYYCDIKKKKIKRPVLVLKDK